MGTNSITEFASVVYMIYILNKWHLFVIILRYTYPYKIGIKKSFELLVNL